MTDGLHGRVSSMHAIRRTCTRPSTSEAVLKVLAHTSGRLMHVRHWKEASLVPSFMEMMDAGRPVNTDHNLGSSSVQPD